MSYNLGLNQEGLSKAIKAFMDASTPRLGLRRHTLRDQIWPTPRAARRGGAESPDSGSENDIGRAIILSSLGRCDILVGSEDWHSEPSICRVADGISSNVDRVSALGNAVVPQIPELIGRAILDAMEAP